MISINKFANVLVDIPHRQSDDKLRWQAAGFETFENVCGYKNQYVEASIAIREKRSSNSTIAAQPCWIRSCGNEERSNRRSCQSLEHSHSNWISSTAGASNQRREARRRCPKQAIVGRYKILGEKQVKIMRLYAFIQYCIIWVFWCTVRVQCKIAMIFLYNQLI